MPQFFKQLIFSRELNFLFLSIFLFAVSMGINLVTFPTILNQNGVSAAAIAIAFTIDIFGGILMSLILSKLTSRFTMIRVLKVSVYLYAAIILLIYFYQNFYLWAILMFLMGSLWFSYVITRQSWFNMLLENKQRGIATGIFSMTISAGIAAGPLLVKIFGAENYLSFIASAALVIFSFLCLRPLKNKPQPTLESKRLSLTDFFKNNPRIFLARFFLDFQTYLLLTFSVVFGVKIGFSYESAGLLISAFLASGFCDVLVGFALIRLNPYRLIFWGFLGCATCFLAIIFIRNYSFLLVAYFTFGVFIACIYVSVFKVTNDDYEESKLVAANSTFQLIGSGGAFFGSLFGGILFKIFGVVGFPIAMISSCICYLTFLIFYKKRREKF